MFKCKKIPKDIQAKATIILTDFKNGIITCRKSKAHKYLVLEVTLRYRLLNKGKHWVLLSHEDYSKQVLI